MEPIAIIGMGGRFPGAGSVDALWSNLRAGVESITRLSREELLRSGVDASIADDPAYVPCKGVLEGADLFDAGLFQISAREAEILDPQHRLFLECAWEALESAGCDPARFSGAIGVWAGCGSTDYWHRHVARNARVRETAGDFQITIANDKDFLATRVAYKLNLRGPAITVQTACSTSLVAVALACQSLNAHGCDLALAGGSSISFPLQAGYLYRQGMILAPDGHCRSFDAEAKGTVPGDAVGIVALKRLSDAERDGDRVLAVIRGVGINNDGASKIGFVAPSAAGQTGAISLALADAQVSPASITYVEAHGTATELGDPIEFGALTEAFRRGTDARGFCALGSVKTNIGHTNAAAGVAGLIKTVKSLEHREIPPSLHFERPNPRIQVAESPFFVNAELREWDAPAPRRAGVSSFGVGGTNAHMIVEQAPQVEASEPTRGAELLVMSAASQRSLAEMPGRLSGYLTAHPAVNLADVAHTLQTGRRELAHRRFVVASTMEEAARKLEGEGAIVEPAPAKGVVFLFPGQGSQYPRMAQDLYRRYTFFREIVDECCATVQQFTGVDLLSTLYGNSADGARALQDWAQPVVFTVEYALARLYMHWGIVPSAMIGHSIGEYAAACIAGVFELHDALRIVCERNRLTLETKPGAMLSIPLPEREVRDILTEGISLAAVNGPSLCVVSGDTGSIDALHTRLEKDGLECRRLHVSRAMHSALMDPMLPAFRECVAGTKLNAPQISFLSSLTGTWIQHSEALDPDYWVRHLRQPVMFESGLRELFAHSDWALLELGPGATLTTLAKRHPACPPTQTLLTTVRRQSDEQDDVTKALSALGELWLRGSSIDWPKLHEGERRRRVGLPTYTFDRQRYWIEAGRAETMVEEPPVTAEPSTREKLEISEWFHAPVWNQEPAHPATAAEPGDYTWLIFSDGGELSDSLAIHLDDARVMTVREADCFERLSDRSATIDPWDPDSYRALFNMLKDDGFLPSRIVHLWCATPCDETESASAKLAALDQTEALGIYSLLHIAQAIGQLDKTLKTHICVVTRGLFDVEGSGAPAPERATVLGPARVIPQEYPDVSCAVMDMAASAVDEAEYVLREALPGVATPFRIVALRDGLTWIPGIEKRRIESPAPAGSRLRENGVYLITGGLGGIGLTLAAWLAESVKARLILVGRSGLGDDRERIERVRAMEESGAEVLVVTGDVTSLSEMEAAVQIAVERFGAIHGAIHAAGLPSGGAIQRKTRADVARILDPKVRGTLVLDAVLADRELDFMLLCSSLTALIGGFGQSDYCAANCFLDAWANARPGVQSVNWDGWQEVGMAARAAAPQALHVLFDKRRELPDGGIEFQTHLDIARHWVIGEHLVAGRPVLPGTAYIEIARAAVAEFFGHRPIAISDLFLLSPLMAEGGTVDVTVEVARCDGEYEVSVRSGAPGAQKTHMLCRVGALEEEIHAVDVNEWMRACPRETRASEFLDAQHRAIETGSRWSCLTRIHHGEGCALAAIEAGVEAAAELDSFALHPALLDTATDLFLWEAESHLPYSYGRIKFVRPMPARFYSYARLRSEPGSAIRRVDVTLASESGEVIVEISDFCLKAASGAKA